MSELDLKKNITTFTPKRIAVTWVTFEYRNDPRKTIQLGCMAEALIHDHPEFVVCDPETGIKAVKEVQLLIAKVAELEHRIAILEQGL